MDIHSASLVKARISHPTFRIDTLTLTKLRESTIGGYAGIDGETKGLFIFPCFEK